jgi:hypothetical protein
MAPAAATLSDSLCGAIAIVALASQRSTTSEGSPSRSAPSTNVP